MPRLGECICCSKPVSSEASSCPHCGQPNPCRAIPPHPKVQVGQVYRGTIFQQGFFTLVSILPGVNASLREYSSAKHGDEIMVRVVQADAERGVVCSEIKD